MTGPALRARGLVKRYGARSVLEDVNLDVDRGGSIAIVGISGAGKTTLLNLLAAFDRPDRGEIRYGDGMCVPRWSADARDADAIHRQVGFVFQTAHLFEGRTVADNIAVPLAIDRVERQERTERAREMGQRLGLGPRLLDARPRTLSGGERQRAVIARALVRHPLVVLADEPTGNLDPHHTSEVETMLTVALKERGVALVLVTHDLGLAERCCREVAILQDAKLSISARRGSMRRDQARALRDAEAALARELGLRAP